jgi:hypothetical protein
MDDDYNKQILKVKIHAAIICFCFLIFGAIMGFFILFLYPNNTLCAYTTNKYLCNKLICNDGFGGEKCLPITNNTVELNNSIGIIAAANYSVNITIVNSSAGAVIVNSSAGVVIVNSSAGVVIVNSSAELISGLNRYKTIIENVIGHDVGLSLAISAVIVFVFVGCFFGSFWYIKHKPNPIKNYITNKTTSRPIKLTKEELQFTQINPIMKLYDTEHKDIMLKALKNITNAVEKDNGHYFTEAIILYNKGIDQFTYYMKTMVNANDRFELAKKIDRYMNRVQYLQNCIENQKLISSIEIPPVAPVITNL